MQDKSEQTSFYTKTSKPWCLRSGWHTVGLKFMTREKSSDSECLCGLFLLPLGISPNLHLCQLNIADDIGVWKTKAGKGWFISCSDRKRCINKVVNLPFKHNSVVHGIKVKQLEVIYTTAFWKCKNKTSSIWRSCVFAVGFFCKWSY